MVVLLETLKVDSSAVLLVGSLVEAMVLRRAVRWDEKKAARLVNKRVVLMVDQQVVWLVGQWVDQK